jgi:predicted  nucleic acid-binding Zn-ribbon protein
MSGPAEDPFATLLAVQDLDTAIAQRQHRKAALAERRELEQLVARIAALRTATAELDEQRQQLAARLSHLEQQTDAVVSRRRVLESRLYAARGASGRDLQAIEAEIDQLTGHLGQLEDEELAVLAEQEPLEAEAARHQAELDELAVRADQLAAQVAQLDAAIDHELAELAARRQKEAARLPETLARRYEELRARLGGTGAARLIGDRCDGCHLSLPSMEVERIRRLPPDAVVTCEQCGRILVRGADGGA